MDMKSYCLKQVEEAKRYKWIKSQEAGRDLGEAAIHEWVAKYAPKFREEYNQVYKTMVKKVIDETLEELAKLHVQLDKEVTEKIVSLAVKKFTEAWTQEVSKDNHNPQIDNI